MPVAFGQSLGFVLFVPLVRALVLGELCLDLVLGPGLPRGHLPRVRGLRCLFQGPFGSSDLRQEARRLRHGPPAKTAARGFPRPKYLITDLGSEFRGRIFRKAAARLGVVQRFASKDNIYATARLERFWRTLKQMARFRLFRPLTVHDLEQRLELALLHYVCFRPHQGLKGATPAEALLGLDPAAQRAVSPPRGRPGEGLLDLPFAVDFLDRQHRALPILIAA
jgi:hypothetical protein